MQNAKKTIRIQGELQCTLQDRGSCADGWPWPTFAADEDRESQFGKVFSVSGPVVVAEDMVSGYAYAVLVREY